MENIEYKMRNYMEISVRNHMDEVLPEMDVCRCEKCRMDIMAIALNNLKPHYVVTEKGALYAKAGEFTVQHKVDVVSAVAAAAEMVGMRPKHG